MLLYSFSDNVLDSLHCGNVCNVNSGSKLRTGILRLGPIKLLHFGIYVRGITAQVTMEIFLTESHTTKVQNSLTFIDLLF